MINGQASKKVISAIRIGVVASCLSLLAGRQLVLADSPGASSDVETLRVVLVSYARLGPLYMYGFITRRGSYAISLRPGQAWEFHGDRATVQEPNGLYGYIDRHGKMVVPAQYEKATSFYAQRAFVQKKDGPIEVIDPVGKVLFRFPKGIVFADPRPPVFLAGIAAPVVAIVDPKTKLKGAINNRGVVILNAHYNGVLFWGDGRTPVLIMHPFHGDMGKEASLGFIHMMKWGYVDDSGRIVIPLKYQLAHRFSEGLAFVRAGRLGGFIDRTGKWIIKPQEQFYYSPSPFHDGLAVMYGSAPGYKGGWGYIDKTGQWVIKPRFFGARPFSEGLAVVQISDPHSSGFKWGAVNRKGQWIIKPTFDELGRFENGFAHATQGTTIGYVDLHGRWVKTFRNANPQIYVNR